MSAPGFELAVGHALIPLPQVMTITGYGRSAVYAAVRKNVLPHPVKVGRASRWPEDEVLAVRAAILRGDDEGARRALVRQLQARRGKPHLALV
jgi:prophage regulatory protein